MFFKYSTTLYFQAFQIRQFLKSLYNLLFRRFYCVVINKTDDLLTISRVLEGFTWISLIITYICMSYKKLLKILLTKNLLNMNKAELIEAMASDANLTKADAKRALDSFIGATSGALKKGDRVALVGFGSFNVTKRAARKGRNPQTGKEINIAAKKVVKFKPGADLSKIIK